MLIGALALACDFQGAERRPAARDDLRPGVAEDARTLRVLVIPDLEGTLEPCGCSSRPAGGVDRLSAALHELREPGLPSVSLLAGAVFAAPDTRGAASASARAQGSLKQEILVALLAQFGFAAAVPSHDDLQHAGGLLTQLTREGKLELLAESSAEEPVPVGPSLLLREGPYTLGILSSPAPTLDVVPDSAALTTTLRTRSARLRARGAEMVLLFSHGHATTAASLARETDVDVVVHTGSAHTEGNVHWIEGRSEGAEPGAPLADSNRRVLVLSGGGHSEGLWQLDLQPGERIARARYLALDHSAPRDPAVRRVLDQLFARINSEQPMAEQDAVETAGSAKRGPNYVGSQTCAACHTQAYFAWRSTPHGRAYETLIGRGRKLDLECVGCHVTGFGQPGGASLASLQHLNGVGCESCHGAGGAHVDNPQSRAGRLPRAVPERVCLSCHDAAHSDRFDYASARVRLVMPGHGRVLGR